MTTDWYDVCERRADVRLIKHICLDQEGGLPIANHNECCFVATTTVMEPRKQNGCVGQLTNHTSRMAATLDGQQFLDKPGEELLVRPIQRGEFGKPKRGERFLPMVVVVKAGYGQRLRVGFSFIADNGLGGEL